MSPPLPAVLPPGPATADAEAALGPDAFTPPAADDAAAVAAAFTEELSESAGTVEGHAALDRSLIQGIAWTGSVKMAGQLVAWASTIVVARLLTPADYGIVGVATLFVGLVTFLGEFGIGSAIVNLRQLRPHQTAQINTLSVALGVVGLVLSCLLAYPLARFFEVPQLPWVIVALSSAFVITSFRTVPYALLQRDLRFKRLAAFEGGQAVVLAGASVMFAVAGFGYWTLVLANVLGALISTGLVVLRHPHPFARPRRAALGEALTFSRNTLVSRLSFYWYNNADYLVAGKLLSQTAYGAYQLAYSLPLALLDKTSGLVLRVTPAVLSTVRDDKAALRRYFLGITEGIALVTFPITIGMALVAEDFVNVALGSQWRPMILPLQLLATYAAFRSLLPIVGQLLVATRRANADARNAVQQAIVMPVAFLAGSYWGIGGIAAAWLLVHPFFGVRLVRWACERIELPVRRYVQALVPGLSSAALMGVALVGVAELVPAEWSATARLALKVVAGGGAYLLAVLAFHRHRLLAFRRLWQSIRV